MLEKKTTHNMRIVNCFLEDLIYHIKENSWVNEDCNPLFGLCVQSQSVGIYITIVM